MRLQPTVQAAGDSTAPEIASPVRRRRMSVLQRRLLWAGVAVVVLLLLILTPPLVNANRYRIKIADTMSASLGRPVHLDDVSFHMLPVPGFTLRNLVVSEDPAFGSEPTIRANTVEATLRVSSLWHRPVEFATVRFVEPSVNLVRNADGRWNLSDVLLHASRVNSAPTGQRHVGPAPRFPYIEATSGRVNLKLGTEKLPFSLTDADFALWLPSPQQWRVRLVGSPARTDANITDPGTVRLEGELHRADQAEAVPVNFRASWHNAPMGEASRLLTGDDLGWRGTLNLDATLVGTLGNAHLASKLTLGGLRRAEFFPTQPLDLQLKCDSGLQLHPALLAGLDCTLPDDAPQPLMLTAEHLDPLHPRNGVLAIHGEAIPARWALLWAALFSPRVPTDLHPDGLLNLDVTHGGAEQTAAPVMPARQGKRGHVAMPTMSAEGAHGWSGHLTMLLPAAGQPVPNTGTPTPAEGATNSLEWQIVPTAGGGWPTLVLPVTQVRLAADAAIALSAAVSATGYRLTVSGNTSSTALLLPARYLPQLGDGLENILPFPPTSPQPLHLVFRCDKPWGAAQSCAGASSGAATGKEPGLFPGGAAGKTGTPSLLMPQNLSPLEHAPFSTPGQPATPLPPR